MEPAKPDSLDTSTLPFFIFGIMGTAGSGKDLMADHLQDRFDMAIVSFSDPIKRFVRSVFEFRDDTLWGPSSARNETMLVDEHFWRLTWRNFDQFKLIFIREMLDPMRQTAKNLDSLTHWLRYLEETYPRKISARVVLQTLGTEWGRALDPLLWVRYLYKDIVPALQRGQLYAREKGVYTPYTKRAGYNGVIVPDHRFLNEIEYTLKQPHGYVFRIYRTAQEVKRDPVGISGHASEEAQKEISDSLFTHIFHMPEGVGMARQILDEVFVWGLTEEPWLKSKLEWTK